jgi:hypothetical protein
MRLQFLLAILLLAACSEVSTPPQTPPTPTPLVFLPLDVLARDASSTGYEITTVGYVVVDASGARLVDGLSFSSGTTPQPLSAPSDQVWLGTDAVGQLGGALRTAGDIQYALVVARGRLEGPQAYGAGGAYRYHLSDPRLQPLAPQETTVADLLDNSAAYEGRPVRIAGALLTRDDSTLLVDRLGSGGLPEPGARQLKLRSPLRDKALLERLHGAAGGAVRFGQVQVEGFWRAGVLTPLSLLPIS